jgi:glutathione S-transferase
MSKPDYQLVIGTKTWSSWSLRPWLLMRQFNLPFDEVMVTLRTPETASALLAHSPSGKVPALIDGTLTVWDSLAIVEYLADAHPEVAIWPRDRVTRALARCVSAEMHSGFQALRQNCPMDFNARGLKPTDPAAIAADVARIQTIWTRCLAQSGGPFLLGAFSAADAMYAPVVSRFVSYGIALPAPLAAYAPTIMALPAMAEWSRASAEEQRIPNG